jgi:hypothetical protein
MLSGGRLCQPFRRQIAARRQAKPGSGSIVCGTPLRASNVANIDLNGVYVGPAEPSALYRDVNPGIYRIGTQNQRN